MALYSNKETGLTKELMWDCDTYQDEETGEVWQRVYKTKGLSHLTEQVGGSHYKGMTIQPVEFIHRNGIGFVEGCCIKYLCRWKQKNGVEDLKKARHFIDMLIEMEEKK